MVQSQSSLKFSKMPQFDIFSFSSQLFWTFLSFSLLYFSLTYYLLPSVSITIKTRQRKITNLTTSKNAGIVSTENCEYIKPFLNNGFHAYFIEIGSVLSKCTVPSFLIFFHCSAACLIFEMHLLSGYKSLCRSGFSKFILL